MPSSNQAIAGESTAPENSTSSPDLLKEVSGLERELRAVAHDYMRLAGLETRRAGESLVIITALGSLVAVLVTSAWLSLAGWAGTMLVNHNILSAGSVLLLTAAINVLIALIVIAIIRRRSRDLLMSATVNFFKPADPEQEE